MSKDILSTHSEQLIQQFFSFQLQQCGPRKWKREIQIQIKNKCFVKEFRKINKFNNEFLQINYKKLLRVLFSFNVVVDERRRMNICDKR